MPGLSRRSQFVVLCLLFALSGAAVLAVEVVWARLLHRLLGSTAVAVAGVLGSFLAGLGLGSLLADRLLPRVRRPLAAYGLCELAALVGTLGLTAFLPRAHPLLGFPGADLWPLLLVALAVVPVGATLPFAIAAFLTERERVASRLRVLYGLNAVGGGVGALAAVLFGLNYLGEWGTALVCGCGQLLVAVVAMVLARAAGENREVTAQAADLHASSKVDRRLAAVVVFGTGFVVLYWEVLWTRLLTLTIGATVYALAVVTAAVVLGIGCGSLAGRGEWLRRNGGWALPLLAALLLVVGYLLVPRLPAIYLYGVRQLGLDPLFWGSATAAVVAFLPNFVLGSLFPWAAGRFPRRVGRLAALNAVGCLLGAVAGGSLLAPLLPLEFSYRLGVTVVLALAVPASALARGGLPRGRLRRAGALVLVLLIVFGTEPAMRRAVGPRWDVRRLVSGVYQWPRADLESLSLGERERGRHVLSVHRGREVIVTVEKEEAVNTLYVRGNGKVEGSVPLDRAKPSIADMPTQVLLGDLPLALLPPDASTKYLLIGLGSGVTLGSLWHAGRGRLAAGAIDVVEIESAFLDALRSPGARQYFEGILPGDLLDDEPLSTDAPWRLRFGDARRLLEVEFRDERWDAIISQPSEPWIPAAASLFTTEFFRVAASRLSEDGVFVQWLQIYKIDGDSLRTLVRTFRTAFERVYVVRPPGTGELVLIGSNGTVRLERLLAAPAGPLFVAARLDGPMDRLAVFLAGPRGVDRWVGLDPLLPIHRDGRTHLLFDLTRSLYRGRDLASENLAQLREIAGSDPIVEYLPTRYTTNDALRRELAERNRHFGDVAEADATAPREGGAPAPPSSE